MKLGLICVAVSVLCLVGSMAFGAPLWVNGVGLVAGIVGLFLLSRRRKG